MAISKDNPFVNMLDEDDLRLLQSTQRGKKASKLYHKALGDTYKPENIESEASPSKEMSFDNPLFALLNEEEPTKTTKPSLFGMTPENIEKAQQELGGGNIELIKNIPMGAKDIFLKQLAAIQGKTREEAPITPSQYPEYAKAGRQVGSVIGGTPALLAGTAAGGAVGGLPGAILGGAAVGYGTTPGDVIERTKGALEAGAMPLIPKIPGVLKSIGSGISSLGKGAYNIAKSPFQKLSPLESKLAEVSSSVEESAMAEQAAKDLFKEQTGSASPYIAKGKAKEKLANLKVEEPSNLPTPSTKVSAEKLDEATKSHESAKKLVSDIEDKFDRYVKKGAAHPIHVASDVNKKIEIIENHYADRYKALNQRVAENKFEMPEKAIKNYEIDHNKILEAYIKGDTKALKEGKFTNEPEISPTLQSIMDKAPTAADTDAATFMAKYKDLRDYSFDLSQKMKTATATEREEIKQALKESKGLMNSAKEALDKGLGEVEAKELKEINRGYSDVIFPLRSLNLAKKFQKSESLPQNMIKALSGESAYPRTKKGQEALRSIVKSDPENIKHLIGQKYAGKIEKLHDYDELTKEYLDRLPELKKLLQEHKVAKAKVPEAEKIVSEAKAQHEKLTKEEKKAQELADKQRFDYKLALEKKADLEKKIKSYDDRIDELKKLSKQKKINLKEKVKYENEISKIKKRKSLANKALLGLVTIYFGQKAVRGFSNAYNISKEGEK